MITPQYPGVYVVEIQADVRPIEGVPTRATELLGPEAVARLQRALADLAPEWTDANIHDPGITLLEVCAYAAESLLYRAHRIPDAAVPILARLAAAAVPLLEGRTLPKECALRSVRRPGNAASD